MRPTSSPVRRRRSPQLRPRTRGRRDRPAGQARFDAGQPDRPRRVDDVSPEPTDEADPHPAGRGSPCRRAEGAMPGTAAMPRAISAPAAMPSRRSRRGQTAATASLRFSDHEPRPDPCEPDARDEPGEEEAGRAGDDEGGTDDRDRRPDESPRRRPRPRRDPGSAGGAARRARRSGRPPWRCRCR